RPPRKSGPGLRARALLAPRRLHPTTTDARMRLSRVFAATLLALALSTMSARAEDPPPTGPSPCVQECATAARAAAETCQAGGGTLEACRQAASAQYLQCATVRQSALDRCTQELC